MSQGRTFVGKYETYPDLTGKRVAEGGRRLTGSRPPPSSGEPLVSIITVCWNSEKTLEQTIDSVRAQTYRNIEYIIIDAASSDGTIDIVSKQQDFIDYYVSEPDDGLYYAMNKGLELAKGEYILILNSDDWYEANTVEELVRAKDYSGCDFVAALARYVDEETGETNVLRSMPFNHSQYLRMSVRHETMLVPADLYDKLGPYDVQYRILSDREYVTRLFSRRHTFYEIHEPLLNFRTSGISNSNRDLLAREQKLMLANDFPFLSDEEIATLCDQPAITPQVYQTISSNHLDQPEFVKACRALVSDRKTHNAKKWKDANLDAFGAGDPGMYPKVSVILPFYAAERTIEESLASVLNQSLKEIEVICVDDCAIDGSAEIVKSFCENDARVRLVVNPENLGLGTSRNAGIRAARGRYIFHLDPDDQLPADALVKLYDVARNGGHDMVKGAFLHEQGVHGSVATSVVKYPPGVSDQIVRGVSLQSTPELLNSTEGHWSYLYDADFAVHVPYPTDLKMGQDSIFLVNALSKAQSIALIPDVIYHYRSNDSSAMNSFTVQKFFDALEWRRRAWHVLASANFHEVGNYLLFSYWNPIFFSTIKESLSTEDFRRFLANLFQALGEAGFSRKAAGEDAKFVGFFQNVMKHRDVREAFGGLAEGANIRVATLITKDHGGAGVGSQRRVRALRKAGIQAEIICILKNGKNHYIRQMPVSTEYALNQGDELLTSIWQRATKVTDEDVPEVTAQEYFSKTASLVDFTDFHSVFDKADIVHMHWVVGMLDYRNAPKVLGKKPVVWTLADMNAFTGGCHYSEGCEGYTKECRECPLTGGSDLAHKQWQEKKEAYGAIEHLQIICPSEWLAKRVKASSLLGERPVHVIPNAIPASVFEPLNKYIARKRLGLPFDKKLILFGAENVGNLRKGGDILEESLRRLQLAGALHGTHGVVFGASELELDIETHSVGLITNQEKLAWVYAAADVFAFPSREDNAPLTVAEAMLCGTPVVGFNVGNVPELVSHEKTGYIAKYLDIDDFSNGLLWALEKAQSPEALSRSLQCHLDAKTYNDPVTSARRQIALYKEMLRQESGSKLSGNG